MRITYATRRSQLALAQSRAFVASLVALRPDCSPEELQVVTSGDRIVDRPLSEVGGKGLFVKEIEEALLERRADIAVHSIKDVPAVLPEGLVLACCPVREDARDVLVSPKYGTLEGLPKGARVGTSSLRRAVSILRARPDVLIVPLRGNVDTRLGKVQSGECDAILLAYAGLRRLGLGDRATEVLLPEIVLPAVGQGALGIECREDDAVSRDLLQSVRHVETEVCVAAERGVMRALDGDCKTPIGAWARRSSDGKSLLLDAFVSLPDGTAHRFDRLSATWTNLPSEAQNVGLELGKSLALGAS